MKKVNKIAPKETVAEKVTVKTQKEATPNKLFYGDNLEVLRKYIKDESVDLCYIDPPFNSKRNYNQIYNRVGKEDKAQAQAFIDTWTWDAMADKGYEEIMNNYNGLFTAQTISLISGLKNVLGQDTLLAYLISITLRVVEIHRVLKPTGSFYLHCDPTASHYIKLVLDAIFCANRKGEYLSDIVWRRTTAHGNAKQGSKKFEINFDTIFFYSKSDNYTFNTAYEPFKQEQIDQQYNKFDEQGRRYRLVTPTAAKGGGDTSYEFHGVKPPKGRFWAYSKENMEKFNEEEKLYFSNTGQPYIKYYLDERPGVAVMSFWDDIKPMSPTSKERLGYPTQKPEALLERIIKASSNAGDVVLDAYCGCGTTVAVAERLHRKWIGIDITYQSISLILKRLEERIGKTTLANIELNGVPQDMKSAIALANKTDDRTRKEFEKWCVLTYSNNRAMINEQKGGDKGIDGIGFIQERDKNTDVQPRKIIFSVKSDVALHPSYIRDLKGTMEREEAVMGVFISLYDTTKGMKEEAHKAGTYKNNLFNIEFPKLTVVNVQEILDGARLITPRVEVVKKAEYKGKENKSQITMEGFADNTEGNDQQAISFKG
ncbi:MAG: site-specific DNA-methyltransferase [Bacteroidota bacterium]